MAPIHGTVNASRYVGWRSPGRAEDWFTDSGQITKREVRAIVIGLLGPAAGETLWDIGAGSGAIGIEWLLADARNQATAVESRADRAAGRRAPFSPLLTHFTRNFTVRPLAGT